MSRFDAVSANHRDPASNLTPASLPDGSGRTCHVRSWRTLRMTYVSRA